MDTSRYSRIRAHGELIRRHGVVTSGLQPRIFFEQALATMFLRPAGQMSFIGIAVCFAEMFFWGIMVRVQILSEQGAQRLHAAEQAGGANAPRSEEEEGP